MAESVVRAPRKATPSSDMVLAGRNEISVTAVSRFCHTLGFGTFPQFKIRLAHDLAQPLADIHEGITAGESIEGLTRRVFRENIQTLTDTLHVLDRKGLADAVEMIASAVGVAGQHPG